MDDENIWSLIETFSDHHLDDSSTEGEKTTYCLCQYCGSDEIILEEGNYVCLKCSSITMRYIDQNAEWRYYGADDNKAVDPTRCGMPVNDLLPNSSLGSVISNKIGESYGMKIVRKHHFWNSVSYKERNLYHVFDNITTNAVNNGIPACIIEDAKVIYKELAEKKMSRGDNKNAMIATSIYMSCKNHKVPRSFKEIAQIFNIKNTTMTKGCKRYQNIMRVNVSNTTPEDFINRFGCKINLSPEIRDICKVVMRNATDLGVLSENTPPSIAAGVIYMVILVCKLDVSKVDLSDVCGISPVTILKCQKKLHSFRDKLLPKEVIVKYSVR